MNRLGVVLALLLGALPLAAQDARLVLREAAFVDREPWLTVPDTNGWDHAVLDGRALRLGDVLLPLGEGDVRVATADFDPFTHAPQISLTLGEAAATSFAALTAERIGQAIAIVLDGRVLIAPTIEGRIANGRVSITGDFTTHEVDTVVRAIRQSTGAMSEAPEERWADVRASVDDATPSAAVRSYIAASNARDWLTVAQLLHPGARQTLREDLAAAVEVQGDSLRFGGEEGAWVPFSFVLGEAGDGRAFADLSDPEAVAVLFAASGATGHVDAELRVHGEVEERTDRVHVVLSVGLEDGWSGYEAPGFSRAQTMTAERIGDRWVVLLPEAGW